MEGNLNDSTALHARIQQLERERDDLHKDIKLGGLLWWANNLRLIHNIGTGTICISTTTCGFKVKAHNLSSTEMVEAMKKDAKLNVELTVEERNLVSIGYKNVIGARRASWCIFSSIEQKEDSKGHEQNVKRIKSYCQRVEDELTKIRTV